MSNIRFSVRKCRQVPRPHTYLRSPKPMTSPLSSVTKLREPIKMFSMHNRVSFSHYSTCNFIWISCIPLCTILDHTFLWHNILLQNRVIEAHKIIEAVSSYIFRSLWPTVKSCYWNAHVTFDLEHNCLSTVMPAMQHGIVTFKWKMYLHLNHTI